MKERPAVCFGHGVSMGVNECLCARESQEQEESVESRCNVPMAVGTVFVFDIKHTHLL